MLDNLTIEKSLLVLLMSRSWIFTSSLNLIINNSNWLYIIFWFFGIISFITLIVLLNVISFCFSIIVWIVASLLNNACLTSSIYVFLRSTNFTTTLFVISVFSLFITSFIFINSDCNCVFENICVFLYATSSLEISFTLFNISVVILLFIEHDKSVNMFSKKSIIKQFIDSKFIWGFFS